MHIMFPGLQTHGPSKEVMLSRGFYPLQPKAAHPASGFRPGVSANLDWDWCIVQRAESPPANFLTVPCKGQPRCPTAASAVQRALTSGTVRYIWPEFTVQVWTPWRQQVNPRHATLTGNQCWRLYPQPASFPVAFLQLESCHLLLQGFLALSTLLVRIVPIKPLIISGVWMKCREII